MQMDDCESELSVACVSAGGMVLDSTRGPSLAQITGLTYQYMVQVIPSRGLKVAGLLGPASPTDRKGANISDTPVGIGGTTQWKLAGLVRSLLLPTV